MLAPGTRFGRYLLGDMLGQGAVGAVYAAELVGAEGFRKPVALKLVHAGLGDPNRPTLVDEANLAVRLHHPHIVEVYDLGVRDDLLFMAMEIVHGPSLSQLLKGLAKRGMRLSPRAVVRLGVQLCRALAHAHSHGVVHRDLKPGNVLLDLEGRLKVADFGIADLQGTLTRGGEVSGTLGYMAPEQMDGAAADPRMDLFSLGLVLYQAATGERLLPLDPPKAMRATANLERWLDERAQFDKVDRLVPGLATALRSCLEADPARRVQDARHLADRLRELPVPPGPALGHYVALLSGRLAAEDLDAVAQQTPAAAPRRGTVPSRPSRFVGRAALLDHLAQSLADGARLLTLTGPPGVGKTRMAQRFAGRFGDDFVGGAWFIDLSGARDASGLLRAASTGLQVPFGEAEPVDHMGAALRARGPALVLLDQGEAVVDEVAAIATRWLRAAPDLRLLVTSREALRAEGEVRVEVPPLEPSDAVALFVDRALRVRPSLSLHGDRLDQVIEVVERVDRLPLTIELAAGRVASLELEELLPRLEQPLEVLKGRRGTGRHDDLRAAVRGSWELLSPEEQAVFAQLSVFRGGFTLDLARRVLDVSSVAPASWVEDLIEGLVDKSLVRRVDGHAQGSRFALFHTLRSFAAERLSAGAGNPSGGEVELRRRHRTAVARLGAPDALRQVRLGDGTKILDGLRDDAQNLWAACEDALASGEVGKATRCLEAVWVGVGRHAGPFRRAASLAARLMDSPGLGEPERVAVGCLRAESLFRLGDSDKGFAVLAQARRSADASREATLRAAVALTTGRLHAWSRRNREALGHYADAVSLLQQVGEDGAVAEVALWRAEAHRQLGDLDEARRGFRSGLRAFRSSGNLHLEGVALMGVAAVARTSGESEESRRCLDEALQLFRRVDAQLHEASALGRLVSVYSDLGRWADALAAAERAVTKLREVGARVSQLQALHDLASVQHQAGQRRAARASLESSRRLARELGRSRDEAWRLSQLAALDVEEGALDEATQRLEQALPLLTALGDEVMVATCRKQLGCIARQEDRLDDARRLLEQALAESPSSVPRGQLVDTLGALGEVLLLTGEDSAARARLSEARWLAESAGLATHVPYLGALAAVLARAGEHREALQLLGDAEALGRGVPRWLDALRCWRVVTLQAVGKASEAARQRADLTRRIGAQGLSPAAELPWRMHAVTRLSRTTS